MHIAMGYLYSVGLLQPGAGWPDILLMAGAVTGILLVTSAFTGSLRNVFPAAFTCQRLIASSRKLAAYLASAHVQQLAFFSALYLLRTHVTDAYWVTIGAALFFALFHFPNWFLMWPTAFMAMILTAHMDVYHNLYAAAVAHTIVGSAYEILAPMAIPATFSTFGRYMAEQRELFNRIDIAASGTRDRQ